MNDETTDLAVSTYATVFDSIDAMCLSFVSDWESGQSPEMSRYLEKVGDETRPTLLKNLLFHEIRCRRARGEVPTTEFYLSRYSQFTEIIREVFLEASGLGSDFGRTMTVTPTSSGVKPPAAERLGDYRLLRELGRGGMGVVYEAINVRRGNRVALKTLPLAGGTALHRFKREFRSVADINHPNLIGLYKLEADGGQWFFTMDLIDGSEFLTHVRPSGVLDEERLRSALAQLASAVMALHGAGVIHRDLKPSNVLVDRDGKVVVLDFGLVIDIDQSIASVAGNNMVGTPAYMAPEQASGRAVTAAADWYAVGVMLYESLSGKRPYEGSLWTIIQAKQTQDPPPFADDPRIPEDLAVLCLRLLNRNSTLRPNSFEIVKNLSSADTPSMVSPTTARGSHLMGREHQLAALQDVYKALRNTGNPQTVFVLARSGEGKTTLAEHFLQSIREDKSLVVMAGRCYDRESVPFKALDSLIDSLASYLKALPETEAALLMPDDIEVLAQVFPVLQRVEIVERLMGTERFVTTDEHQVRQRAFAALRSLLIRMSRRSPIIWFVDDLQWGDADSAEALFEVLRPPKAPLVLFLGTYRSDEVEGSAFLNHWRELQRKHDVRFLEKEITLAPLTVEQCVELVIRLLGKENETIRARAIEFARETRGNPFLLTELVGCFDPDTDAFEPIPLHEVLSRKLGRLPDEAGQILDVIAVAGQALMLDEAARTAGHELTPVATVTRMINERLVRLIGPEDNPFVDTYHDRVRETVLGEMDEIREKSLHLSLANYIESKEGGLTEAQIADLFEGRKRDQDKALPRIYDLVYHYDAAGQRTKSWQYALLAAEQARRQSALEVAANNYAVANRNIDLTEKSLRYRIAEGFGGTLMLLGRYDAAGKQLEGVIDLVDDPERKAQIEKLQGEITFLQGFVERSMEIFESGLRRLGVWVPRTRLGLIGGIVRETLIQGIHTLLPFRLHKKPKDARSSLVLQIFDRVAHPAIFSSTPKMVWYQLCGMNRAEMMPVTLHLSLSYSVHCCLVAMIGWSSRGAHYAKRSMTLACQWNDTLAQAYSSGYQGIGHYASARYEESLLCLEKSIKDYEKVGDPYALHLTHFHRGCCQFGLGNLAEAVAEARWIFTSSARIGDSRTLCSTYLWARATRGNLPFAELKPFHPCRPDDVMSTVHGIMAEGHWHTFHGRTAEALEAFEQAAMMVRKSLCLNAHTILVLPNLASAIRKHAEAVEPSDSQLAERLYKRADRLSLWATRITSFFPAAYPIALRERSLILAVRGQTKQALKVAERSCEKARKQKARFELALSECVVAQLRVRLNRPGAAEELTRAEAVVSEFEKQAQAVVAVANADS